MTAVQIADVAVIVEWLPYEDAEKREEAVGGLGGMMDAHHTEDSYLRSVWEPGAWPYIVAIFRALDTLGPVCGFEHQSARCPVFGDGRVATFSLRAWGDLVAAWWNTRFPDDEPLDYRAFAWGVSDEDRERWTASRPTAVHA